MSDSELEEELRALQPARPLAGLEAAIARDLAPAKTLVLRPAAGILRRAERRPRFAWWPSLSWAAAGALAVLLFTLLPKPWNADVNSLAQGTRTVFEPVESAPEILSAENGEVSYENASGPMQLVRYSSIERQAWANTTTGAELEVEMPREDVFLIPVSYQ